MISSVVTLPSDGVACHLICRLRLIDGRVTHDGSFESWPTRPTHRKGCFRTVFAIAVSKASSTLAGACEPLWRDGDGVLYRAWRMVPT